MELNASKIADIDIKSYNDDSIDDIEHIENKLTTKLEEVEYWWNSILTDKVRIYDNENGTKLVFAMENTPQGSFLLNKNQVALGEYREWEDVDNNIADCYKNNSNKVLDPNSAIPLFEYEIYKKTSMYHNLTSGIYREYRYDMKKETLVYTNSIEIVN